MMCVNASASPREGLRIIGRMGAMEKKILPILPTKIGKDFVGAIGYKFLSEVELVLDYDNNFLYLR